MKIELRWLNCILVDAAIAGLDPRVALEKVGSDAHSPIWLLAAENITRILVFSVPILLGTWIPFLLIFLSTLFTGL